MDVWLKKTPAGAAEPTAGETLAGIAEADMLESVNPERGTAARRTLEDNGRSWPAAKLSRGSSWRG